MNQNFSFMKKLVPKVLAGEKIITNRIATQFRMLCDKGDIMHLFTGMRTKNCVKLGDALVVARVFWTQAWLPDRCRINDQTPMFPRFTWKEFAQMDGFDDFKDFFVYFSHKRYENGMYCWMFRIMDNLDKWIKDDEKIKAFRVMTGSEYKDLIRELRK